MVYRFINIRVILVLITKFATMNYTRSQ